MLDIGIDVRQVAGSIDTSDVNIIESDVRARTLIRAVDGGSNVEARSTVDILPVDVLDL